MAQPVLVVADTFPVIGTQFCAPYPVDLAITTNVLTVNRDKFVVTDGNGNLMFKVKRSYFTLRDRLVVVDAAGKPIVTLLRKVFTVHSRWKVYRGESSESSDLLFRVKTSSVIRLKTKLDVFLANNIAEEVCDFKVKGSWNERSCVVYAGESSTIVAQMSKKVSVQSVMFGKDKFMVTVYPNIDHAFIVALIVILNEINSSDQPKST